MARPLGKGDSIRATPSRRVAKGPLGDLLISLSLGELRLALEDAEESVRVREESVSPTVGPDTAKLGHEGWK